MSVRTIPIIGRRHLPMVLQMRRASAHSNLGIRNGPSWLSRLGLACRIVVVFSPIYWKIAIGPGVDTEDAVQRLTDCTL